MAQFKCFGKKFRKIMVLLDETENVKVMFTKNKNESKTVYPTALYKRSVFYLL